MPASPAAVHGQTSQAPPALSLDYGGVFTASQTMSQQILNFCKTHLGQKVGGGECAHLANEALRVAAASGQAAAVGSAAGLVLQSGWSFGLEFTFPGIEGMLGEADEGGEVAGGQAAASPGIEQEQTLLGGQVDGGAVVFGREAFAARGADPVAASAADRPARSGAVRPAVGAETVRHRAGPPEESEDWWWCRPWVVGVDWHPGK